MLRMEPHDAQVRLADLSWHCRFTLAVWGRRCGKSLYAAKRVTAKALHKPQSRIWIVAPDYDLTKPIWEEFIADWETGRYNADGEWIPPMPEMMRRHGQKPITVKHGSDSMPAWRRLSNGTLIQCKSAENPRSLLGRGLDHAEIDEFARIPADIWNTYIRPALADRRGSAGLITSPYGFNHVYEMFQKAMDPENAEWGAIQAPTWRNPYIDPEEIESAWRDTNEDDFWREYGAEFRSLAGRVFPYFTYDDNVVAREIPEHTPIYVGIDFGWHWFVATLMTIVNDEPYIFDELVLHKHGTRDALNILAGMTVAGSRQTVKDRAEIIAPDPAGGADSPRSAIDDIDACREVFGFDRVYKGMNSRFRDIEWGCARIRDLVRSASGQVRYRIHPRCKYSIQCHMNYKYPDRKDGQPTPSKPEKDGTHDHGIDTVRYILNQALWRRVPQYA